ncbi:hypothetical protein BDR26DRAFT_969116 [Obelidium mucronatum]|nr:hypothetical protein BDR26DRAFT_969116 [Obelidium mucronatum]
MNVAPALVTSEATHLGCFALANSTLSVPQPGAVLSVEACYTRCNYQFVSFNKNSATCWCNFYMPDLNNALPSEMCGQSNCSVFREDSSCAMPIYGPFYMFGCVSTTDIAQEQWKLKSTGLEMIANPALCVERCLVHFQLEVAFISIPTDGFTSGCLCGQNLPSNANSTCSNSCLPYGLPCGGTDVFSVYRGLIKPLITSQFKPETDTVLESTALEATASSSSKPELFGTTTVQASNLEISTTQAAPQPAPILEAPSQTSPIPSFDSPLMESSTVFAGRPRLEPTVADLPPNNSVGRSQGGEIPTSTIYMVLVGVTALIVVAALGASRRRTSRSNNTSNTPNFQDPLHFSTDGIKPAPNQQFWTSEPMLSMDLSEPPRLAKLDVNGNNGVFRNTSSKNRSSEKSLPTLPNSVVSATSLSRTVAPRLFLEASSPRQSASFPSSAVILGVMPTNPILSIEASSLDSPIAPIASPVSAFQGRFPSLPRTASSTPSSGTSSTSTPPPRAVDKKRAESSLFMQVIADNADPDFETD